MRSDFVKNQKKKLFLSALLLLLSFTLTACNRGEDDDAEYESSAETKLEAAAESEEEALDAVEGNENSSEIQSQSGDGAFSMQRGTWDGELFYNPYSRLSFVLPEGFLKLTDDLLSMSMGQDAGSMTEYERANEFTIGSMVVIDAGVVSFLGDSITVTYQSELLMLRQSEVEFLDALVFERIEALDVEIDYVHELVELSGNIFYSLTLEYEWMREDHREMILIRRENGYLIMITIVSEHPVELLENFK